MAARGGLSWRWSQFGLGALYAAPALGVAPNAPAAALALSIGVLPAAAMGLPPRRRGRIVIPLFGAVVALGLVFGATIALVPVVAVVALGGISVLAAGLAAHRRAGRLTLTLFLPMMGIGLSFPLSTTTMMLAVAILCGSIFAWAVGLFWPEQPEKPRVAATVPKGRALWGYGVLLGAAASTAAAIGFTAGLEHVGWATGTVLLVMRPVRGQLVRRSVGRAGSVLVGALAATGLAVLSPNGVVIGVAIALAVGALCATHESRWYVAPAFTTFLVLTLLVTTSTVSASDRLLERTAETLLGVAIALFFGAFIPTLLAMRRPGKATAAE